jgi:YesN/AraC family two-component response regulator
MTVKMNEMDLIPLLHRIKKVSPRTCSCVERASKQWNKAKMNSFLHKLESEMNEKEVYKKTYLTLDNLAHDLGTNRTFLSKLIHTHYGVPFNTYINNLRITKAIEIMKHNEDVGDIDKIDTYIQSRRLFQQNNIYFRIQGYTGLTPSVFMKKLHQLN